MQIESIYESSSDRSENKKPIINKKILLSLIGCMLFAVILVTTLALKNESQPQSAVEVDQKKDTNDSCISAHENYIPHKNSKLGKYTKAAIAADSVGCSTIGKDILLQNGSAVDAAIATGVCNGLLNPHSMGIGGGHFMLIYLKDRRTVIGIDARETAPMKSTEDMFVKSPKLAFQGGLASGIPGEIAGYRKAHQIAGKLPWKKLFEPSIDLCKNGIKVSPVLAMTLKSHEDLIKENIELSKLFIDHLTNQTYKENDIIKMLKLADTLEKIGEQGAEAFYNGELSKIIVEENRLEGGIFTLDDLKSYKPAIRTPIEVKLTDKYRLYALPPPSSGILVSFILNVMSRLNLSNESVSTAKKSALYYHRLIETFKHTFAKRSTLGDIDFVDVARVIQNLTDSNYINKIISLINDTTTFDQEYYEPAWPVKTGGGTTHISVVAANGDAVSFTSTINTYFGAMYSGGTTGIIYNNEMDDFSTPGTVNYFGVPASQPNFIQPGKRPMSSMSPIIVLDQNDDVRLVLGASGGTKIITAVAEVALKNLWLGKDIKEAIEESRIHHQLFPLYAQFESGFPSDVEKLLTQKNHITKCFVYGGSVVQGIERRNDNSVWANSDFRKGGDTDGYF